MLSHGDRLLTQVSLKRKLSKIAVRYVDNKPMAFSDIEVKRIETTVGELCRKLSPAHLREQVRLEYAVKGHDVVIYERRPMWNNP